MPRIICILLSLSRAPLTNRTRKASYRAMNGSSELLRAFRNMKRLLNPRLLCLDGHPRSFYSVLFLPSRNRLKLSVCCLYGLTPFPMKHLKKAASLSLQESKLAQFIWDTDDSMLVFLKITPDILTLVVMILGNDTGIL